MFDSDPAQIIPSAQDGTPLASEGRNGKTVAIVALDREMRCAIHALVEQNKQIIEILTEIRDART